MTRPVVGSQQEASNPEFQSANELGSDRTSELRKKGYAGRRLGPKQMTTDTAVRVTRMVVHEKGHFCFP